MRSENTEAEAPPAAAASALDTSFGPVAAREFSDDDDEYFNAFDDAAPGSQADDLDMPLDDEAAVESGTAQVCPAPLDCRLFQLTLLFLYRCA